MAWQARHLLNEVLPAAASCACAPDAAANEVTTTSALKVDVFMWCSSFLPKERGGFLVAGSPGLDKPPNHDRFHNCRLVPERTDGLTVGNPTFGWPTQTAADVLDLPPQIVIPRGLKATLEGNGLEGHAWPS